MDTYIAVDVGGTQIRVAVYPKGETSPQAQKRIPTQAAGQTPLDRVQSLIAELWPAQGDVRAIGLAVPGWVDPQKGVIYQAPNIPGWDDLPLVAPLQERFKTPVKLGNDANMAVVGEWLYGAGRGHNDVIYMTISTGIGGGVISGGHLVVGRQGLATELGHITLIPDGPLCSCGHYGHLEAVGSGTAIQNYVIDQLAKGVPSCLSTITKPTGRDISQAAEQGDALANEAMTRAGIHIGHALANYVTVFNPSIIVLGGGVSQSGSLIFDPIRKGLSEWILSPEYLQNLVIAPAELGDDAGLMGTMALASGAVD